MNKKSILVKQIQQLSGVEGVELMVVEPCKPDYMLCHIYFDPESVVDRLGPEEVAQRNYSATEKRGFINENTEFIHFKSKLLEEVYELTLKYNSKNSVLESADELADISLVCDSMAIHYGIDLQAEKEKKMLFNEIRKD